MPLPTLTTLERINKTLVDHGFVAVEDTDSRFREDIGMDSLDLVEFIMAMEEEFGFDISDDDVDGDKITTVKQAVEYIDKRLNEDGN